MNSARIAYLKDNQTFEIGAHTFPKLSFNTGRGYSLECQIIHAYQIDDNTVYFYDVSRNVDHFVTCRFHQDDIMHEYDNSKYLHPSDELYALQKLICTDPDIHDKIYNN